MRLTFSALIILFFFVSCTDDSSKDIDDTPPSSDKIKIDVVGLPNLIDKTQAIEVSIQSGYDKISTSLTIDGKEVAQSNEKGFLVNIDPFEFNSGPNTLKVHAVAEDGTANEVSFDFQIKKLLIHLNYLFTNVDFVALHTLNGELVDYKTYNGQPLTFYAEDGFERQNFIVTGYQLNSFNNTTYINSYADLEPGTTNLSFAEQEDEFGGLRLGITDKVRIQFSSLGNHLIGGYHGVVQTVNGNLTYLPLADGEYDFLYNKDLQEDFYLFSIYENEPMFKNKFIKTDIENLKTTTFSEEDFTQIDNYREVSVSNEGLNYSKYTIEGYKDYADYLNYKFHIVHTDNISSRTNYKIRIPDIEGLDSYQVKFSATLGTNSSVEVRQHFELNQNEISIPSMNIIKQDSSITFNGEMEYDYSILTYNDYTENEPDDYSDFRWRYFQRFKQEISLSIFDLKHPDEILNLMNSSSLDPSKEQDDGKVLQCSLINHEDELTYENLIFSQGYYSNEKGYQYIFNFEGLLP